MKLDNLFDKSIKESLAEIGGFFQRDRVLKSQLGPHYPRRYG